LVIRSASKGAGQFTLCSSGRLAADGRTARKTHNPHHYHFRHLSRKALLRSTFRKLPVDLAISAIRSAA